MYHRKDASLDRLAGLGNVAQFVSFEPVGLEPRQTYARVAGHEPNHPFDTPRQAVAALLAASVEGSVNVRSYEPSSPRSREFVYGLNTIDEALAVLERITTSGLHVIVNETVDVNDGGVSGVVQGGVIEFAPDDTPRCVEQPGVASLPLRLGLALLRCVYGFVPEIPDVGGRIEFSVHPRRRGWKGTHTLLWEVEEDVRAPSSASMAWPNRFSRHLGDKLYGLLLADLVGARVPRTDAICRRVASFSFGSDTGSFERWLRTCPREPEPGLFTTLKGWADPFALLAEEDPQGDRIAAVLSQSAVRASYAGASIVDAVGNVVVEGVSGEGDLFMLGRRHDEGVPAGVEVDVRNAVGNLARVFGPVRTEWVHDGENVWIVQLHRGATVSDGQTLVPGEAARWVAFDVSDGLEALRSLIVDLDADAGIQLRGGVGMTSHVADLVRKARVPTRIVADGS